MRLRSGFELYWRAPCTQWLFVTTRPSGDTNEALQPPSETIAPIGWPVRSAKACGSPVNPIAVRREASCGICWGIHMPSSASAVADRSTEAHARAMRTRRTFTGFSSQVGIEIARLPARKALDYATPNDAAALHHLHRSRRAVPRAEPLPQVFCAGVTKLPRDLAEDLDDLLSRAFAEDGEDVTSLAVFGPAARLSARIVCRERAVVAGTAFLPRLFAFLSPPAHVTVLVEDGASVAPGAVLAEIEGPAITILAAERTALNLLQRLSGVATMTRRYVDALAGTKAVLLDTRKTTAGLRRLERYAVRCGGGVNHRFGLAWGFLVKDNHADGAGSVWEATRRAKDFRSLNRRLAGILLEAEARTRDEVHQALDAGAERILLDNMPPAAIAEAVADVHLYNEATGARVTTEASGRMTPETARKAAEAGVDYVSAGALTHSVKAIDIGLDVDASVPRKEKKISLKVTRAPTPARQRTRPARSRRDAPSRKSEDS